MRTGESRLAEMDTTTRSTRRIPNTIYCESQQGFIQRYDRKTGESILIQPQPEKAKKDSASTGIRQS